MWIVGDDTLNEIGETYQDQFLEARNSKDKDKVIPYLYEFYNISFHISTFEDSKVDSVLARMHNTLVSALNARR